MKSEKRRRNVIISVRMTQDEYDRAQRRAADAGVTVSALLRGNASPVSGPRLSTTTNTTATPSHLINVTWAS